jgi:hypothetical protein
VEEEKGTSQDGIGWMKICGWMNKEEKHLHTSSDFAGFS